MPLLYRNGQFSIDGAPIAQADLTELRNQQIDRWADELGLLTAEALGIETRARTTAELRQAVEFPLPRIEAWATRFLVKAQEVIMKAFLFARGGHSQMSDQDWQTVTGLITRQGEYGSAFVADVAAGKLTERQIQARSKLYAGAAVEAFERAKAASVALDLPAFPADGSQVCRSQCRCSWAVRDFSDRWEATWILESGGQHCATCLGNADKWKPFVQRKSEG